MSSESFGLTIHVQKFTKYGINLKCSLMFLQNIQGQSQLEIYKQVEGAHLPLNSSCIDMTSVPTARLTRRFSTM